MQQTGASVETWQGGCGQQARLETLWRAPMRHGCCSRWGTLKPAARQACLLSYLDSTRQGLLPAGCNVCVGTTCWLGTLLPCAVQVCVPLFDMIRHWVFDGQLEDPACEFFIVPNTQSVGGSSAGGGGSQQQPSGERDLWRDAYRLEPAKLPPFITQV